MRKQISSIIERYIISNKKRSAASNLTGYITITQYNVFIKQIIKLNNKELSNSLIESFVQKKISQKLPVNSINLDEISDCNEIYLNEISEFLEGARMQVFFAAGRKVFIIIQKANKIWIKYYSDFVI